MRSLLRLSYAGVARRPPAMGYARYMAVSSFDFQPTTAVTMLRPLHHSVSLVNALSSLCTPIHVTHRTLHRAHVVPATLSRELPAHKPSMSVPTSAAAAAAAPLISQADNTAHAPPESAALNATPTPPVTADLHTAYQQYQPSAENMELAYNSSYKVNQLAIDIFTSIHNTTGLPWWLTITGVALSVRLLLVPVVLYQLRTVAYSSSIVPPLAMLFQDAGQRTVRSSKFDSMRAQSTAIRAIRKQLHCQSYKDYLTMLIQIPVYLWLLVAARKLVMFSPELQTGGALWFTNLTAADPYLIIPLSAIGLSLLQLHLISDSINNQITQMTKLAHSNPALSLQVARSTLISKFLTLCQAALVTFAFFFTSFPVGIYLFWLVTAAWGVMQTLLLRRASVRRMLGLTYPPLPPPTQLSALSEHHRSIWQTALQWRDWIIDPRAGYPTVKIVPASTPAMTAKLNTTPIVKPATPIYPTKEAAQKAVFRQQAYRKASAAQKGRE